MGRGPERRKDSQCGRRNERSVHIACSLKTRSELVIPIKDKEGNFVAELDIDSNKLNAFSPEKEELFNGMISEFPLS